MDSILSGYSYLQPPVEVNLIQHDPNYIKSGSKENAQRRIFYAVPLDDFELSKIQELELALHKKGERLPPGWNERETLRYIYGAKFDLDTAIANIQVSLRWRGSHNNHVIPDGATRLLESGAVYTYGRDNLFRPIVIIDFGKLNIQNFDNENFQIALITLLDILKDYCFVPGRVENWIVILDTRRINFLQFPKELSPIKTLLTACYPLTLERLIVVNASESVFSSWKSIEGLVDQTTLKKIVILEPNHMSRLHSILPKNQLEAKFGGTLPDLNKFWIPRVPFSNISPTKSTNNNNNVESSLARLSQQIENVEGKFQRMLSPEAKPKGSQTTSPNYQVHTAVSQNYNTSSPERVSGFPEPRNYKTNYSVNQGQPSLQSPYGREQRELTGSSRPVASTYEEFPRLRTEVTPGVTEYYREYQPQRQTEDAPKKSYVPPEENNKQAEQKVQGEPTEASEVSSHYDFNDSNLIDLILTENDILLTNKIEAKSSLRPGITNIYEPVTMGGNYGSDVYRQEVFRSIQRSSTGDRPKTFSEYNTQPERRTGIPDSIITRHQPLIEGENAKKSSPYSVSPYTSGNVTTTTYVTRSEYSQQPNPRFVQGRTEYEISKSNLPPEQIRKSTPIETRTVSNQPGYSSVMRTSQAGSQVEEWNPQKYAKKKEEEDVEELEGGSDFCGLCVRSRKKEKVTKA